MEKFDTKKLLEELEKFTFEIYYPTWYDYFSGEKISPPKKNPAQNITIKE